MKIRVEVLKKKRVGVEDEGDDEGKYFFNVYYLFFSFNFSFLFFLIFNFN